MTLLNDIAPTVAFPIGGTDDGEWEVALEEIADFAGLEDETERVLAES